MPTHSGRSLPLARLSPPAGSSRAIPIQTSRVAPSVALSRLACLAETIPAEPNPGPPISAEPAATRSADSGLPYPRLQRRFGPGLPDRDKPKPACLAPPDPCGPSGACSPSQLHACRACADPTARLARHACRARPCDCSTREAIHACRDYCTCVNDHATSREFVISTTPPLTTCTPSYRGPPGRPTPMISFTTSRPPTRTMKFDPLAL